jgi:hypothetical protein
MADVAHAARLWKPLSPPPKLAAENFRPRASHRRRRSRVSGGLPKPDPPQTPRIRPNPADSDSGRAIVSATADGMAVGGVGSELVSVGDSLICRESTGKFPYFGRLRRRHFLDSRVDPGSWNRVPYGLEQGILPREQGIPGAKQGIGTPCFPSPSGIRQCRCGHTTNQDSRHSRSECTGTAPSCGADEY